MSTTEGMGRRLSKDGDEVDYLTTKRGTSGPVANHGLRKKIKVDHNRRTRRQARGELRNGQES